MVSRNSAVVEAGLCGRFAEILPEDGPGLLLVFFNSNQIAALFQRLHAVQLFLQDVDVLLGTPEVGLEDEAEADGHRRHLHFRSEKLNYSHQWSPKYFDVITHFYIKFMPLCNGV